MDRRSWKLKELQIELRQRGAKVTGRKFELIERLEAYDKNQNFVQPSQPTPCEVPMPNWPQSGFKSVTASDQHSLPNITSDVIRDYVLVRQGIDRRQNLDYSSMKKGLKMKESSAVLALSFLTDLPADKCFFSAIVGAAMKKNVNYNVKVVAKNVTGDILNSGCDCPSGSPPHATCKHVVALLMVLAEFLETSTLSVSKSCTEEIQTFSKPRKLHNASPMKCDALKKASNSVVLDEDEDPRPTHMRGRPSYQDEVNNFTTNYVYHSGLGISMRYTYGYADIQQAAIDHDYLDSPFPVY